MSEPNGSTAVATVKRSMIDAMSAEYDMEPEAFFSAIQSVVFPAKDRNGNPPTKPQMIAYLAVCQHYRLNPFIKQLWPFPVKDGGFVPAMAIDGWLSQMNTHPDFFRDEYEEIRDEKGNLIAGEVKIYLKSRPDFPTIKKCYLKEWYVETNPNWKNRTAHMLEVRTYCQGIRKAFGITGVYEPEEAREIGEINITEQSTVMSRETNTKTEALKEKIGAKKAEKKDEPPKQQTTPAPEPVKVSNEPPPFVPEETKPADDDFPPPEPNKPQEEATQEDRFLTEEERKSILKLLQDKKPATPEQDQQLQKDARQFFMTQGAASTKQLKLSQLQACIEWATNYQIAK